MGGGDRSRGAVHSSHRSLLSYLVVRYQNARSRNSKFFVAAMAKHLDVELAFVFLVHRLSRRNAAWHVEHHESGHAFSGFEGVENQVWAGSVIK